MLTIRMTNINYSTVNVFDMLIKEVGIRIKQSQNKNIEILDQRVFNLAYSGFRIAD